MSGGPVPDEARDLVEVGRLTRPHGVRGDVIVKLTTNRPERVAPGAVLVAPLGPLTVRSSRPHQKGWICTFEEISDRPAAERWSGQVLSAEPIDDPDALWVDDLVGCLVVEVDGAERGEVVALQDNPASDLLVLDSGALVPLRFVVDGPRDGRLVVDVPPGLFDL